MEVFFGKVTQLLPLLGCDLFGATRAGAVQQPLICEIKGLRAYSYRTPTGFLVLKNSEAVAELRPSAIKHAGWMVKMRDSSLLMA